LADLLLSLVRHGAVANPQQVRYGRLPGFVLSEAGRRQAREAGEHLARCGVRVSRLASSPLERAVETATLLGEQLDPPPSLEIDPRLIEVGSRLDGLPRRLAPRAYLARLLDASTRSHAEPAAEAGARLVAAALDLARGASDRVVIVSHQSPIWAATALLLGGPDALGGLLSSLRTMFRRGPPPGHATIVTFAPRAAHGPLPGPGGWKLVDRWHPPRIAP
jgi:broad specificity phosphatase PhoE